MAREKFSVGEVVEMRCRHRRDGQVVVDWLPGAVVQADARMVAVRLEGEVYSNNGWLIHDCTLWCTHGSQNLRRVAEAPGRPGG
jgi:hypothetical protein